MKCKSGLLCLPFDIWLNIGKDAQEKPHDQFPKSRVVDLGETGIF